MMRLASLVLVVVAAVGPARANTFLFTGALDDGDAAADGLFTFELAIVQATEPPEVVWRETQESIIVADGVFAIDVGAVEPIGTAFDARASLQVTVDGDALPPIPLSTFIRVDRVGLGVIAQTAPTTETLRNVRAADAVRRSALAAAGGPGFPFTAINGLPAGVADGDDGVDVTAAGQGLTLGDRRLSVVVGTNGDRFQSGAIVGSRFAAGAITDVKVANNAVTGAKVGTDLTRDDLAAAPGEAQVSGRVLFNATADGCDGQGFTVNPTCQTRACTATSPINGLPVAGRVGCDGTGCEQFNPTTCTNTRIGTLVAP